MQLLQLTLCLRGLKKDCNEHHVLYVQVSKLLAFKCKTSPQPAIPYSPR